MIKPTQLSLSARNLIANITAQTGLTLFGGIMSLVDTAACAVIPEGKDGFRSFFEPFFNTFGIKAVVAKWERADEVIIAAAQWFVDTYANNYDLSENQLRVAALEYLTAAIFTPPAERQSFEKQLPLSIELRKNYKGYDELAELSSPETFEKNYETLAAKIEKALGCFTRIQAILAMNPHLRTLRGNVVVFPVYTANAFKMLKKMDDPTREVVIRLISRGISRSGTYYVDATDVDEAFAETQGNVALLSSGTLSGVSVEVAASVLGISSGAQTQNRSLQEIGACIATLNGSLETAEIKPLGQDGLKVEITIRDRPRKGYHGVGTIVPISTALHNTRVPRPYESAASA